MIPNSLYIKIYIKIRYNHLFVKNFEVVIKTLERWCYLFNKLLIESNFLIVDKIEKIIKYTTFTKITIYYFC